MVTDQNTHLFTKLKISFDSDHLKCMGYFYIPVEQKEKMPCVVMANGFSGTMDWILPSFAERLASVGFAVLIFDYRHLGESEGQPRQLIDIEKQRTDLTNAIHFARHYKGIDPECIALWGTSLGGSHVIAISAHDARIAAAICNMPAIDAVKGANTKAKMQKANVTFIQLISAMLRLLLAAVWDAVRSAVGLSPYYIEVYGTPGKALFTDPALAARFKKVGEQSPTWKNKVAARFLLHVPRYKEGTMERIKAPILFSLATKDIEVSNDFIKAKAQKAPRAEIKEYPYEHFSMYHDEAFEQVVNDQVDFLRKHLQ